MDQITSPRTRACQKHTSQSPSISISILVRLMMRGSDHNSSFSYRLQITAEDRQTGRKTVAKNQGSQRTVNKEEAVLGRRGYKYS